MNRFAQFAFWTVLCDAVFVAVAAPALIIAFRAEPAFALYLGGQVCMFFCLILMHRVVRLERKGLPATDLWQILEPDERPRDAPSLTGARDCMEMTLLRFAKGAAAAACGLFGASLLLSLP